MAKPKSKLIANRSAHTVALSGDGVAASRYTSSKAKKDPVAPEPPAQDLPAVTRTLKPVRRPVDEVSSAQKLPAASLADRSAIAPPMPVAPKAPRKRNLAPQGPSLSESTQTRMRDMAARLQALNQQLSDLQKKRPGTAQRSAK